MSSVFVWDEEKAKTNLKKHDVSFQEGATIFNDTHIATIHDPDHSEDEDRFIGVGYSSLGRLLLINYTERRGCIRIISCRRATRQERKMYEEESI